MFIIAAWHPVVSPCFLAAPLTHPPLPVTLLLLSRLVIDHRHHHHCPLHFLLLIAPPLPLPLFNISISSPRRCPSAAAAVLLPLLLLIAPPLPVLHITTGFLLLLKIDQRRVRSQ